MAAETNLEIHKHLLKFFKLYGVDLDQKNNLISIRKSGFLVERDLNFEREN